MFDGLKNTIILKSRLKFENNRYWFSLSSQCHSLLGSRVNYLGVHLWRGRGVCDAHSGFRASVRVPPTVPHGPALGLSGMHTQRAEGRRRRVPRGRSSPRQQAPLELKILCLAGRMAFGCRCAPTALYTPFTADWDLYWLRVLDFGSIVYLNMDNWL